MARTVLPWVFLALSLATSLFAACKSPPLMGPDELTHVERAEMLTLGEFIPHRGAAGSSLSSGAPVDQALVELQDIFNPIIFHPERKATAADADAAARLRWDARRIPGWFPNTAVYSPLLYLPATEGLAAGKVLSAPVAESLVLARILNALACGLLGFVALRWAGASQVVMAIVLLMPMTSFLFGVVNQDGPTIALCAVGTALMARGAREGRPLAGRELWGAAAAFALVGLAKLPYAFFSLALLWADTPSHKQRWAAALGPLLIDLAWAASMQIAVAAPVSQRADVQPAGQIDYLLHHLGAVPDLAFATVRDRGLDYFHQFVGVLGWLDTPLPGFFYPLAAAILALALFSALLRRGRAAPGWRRLGPAVLIVFVAVLGALFGAEYLQWTPVGDAVVEGLQGRYLIPVAIFLCAALDSAPPILDSAARSRLEMADLGLVSLMGLGGGLAMAATISNRFYG